MQGDRTFVFSALEVYMGLPQTSADLIALLEKSELIERHRLIPFMQSIRELPVPIATAKELAAKMIVDQMVTPFQARLLLQGKWRNFFIGGKYKVLEHIGAGGMGTVYLCEHRHMRRRVAVKLLPPEQTENKTGLERFRREAQVVAMLNHPNLVRAHDIDQDGPVHYFVMEFIDGVSLYHLIQSHGPISVERTVNYIAQTASGLQHAHENGLVHRDIKPSNLLLDRRGVLKILDLGLARIENSTEQLTMRMDSKVILGTADYLSPEQAKDSGVDIRADIYSLGATMYFMLLGKAPFADGNMAQKLMWHQSRDIPVPHSIRSEIPIGVSQVIQKMMAKNPDHRYQKPTDVLEALRPWLVAVPPPSADEMPESRFLAPKEIETLSKLSTLPGIPATTRSQMAQASSAGMSQASSAGMSQVPSASTSQASSAGMSQF